MENEKTKKILYILFVTIIMVICLIPSLGMLVFGESEAGANEILADRPVIFNEDGKINESITDDITSYIADRCAFRQEYITAYAELDALIFRESASEKVLLGKDGWLFYEQTTDDYLNSNTLSDRSLYGISRTLELMQEYLQNEDTDFIFTIAPNKNSIYNRYMTNIGEPLQNEGNLELLPKYISGTDVNYVDLYELLSSKDEQLYHRLDSHWNNRGAAFARDKIISSLGDGEMHGLQDMAAGERKIIKNHKGDLYEMLYPAGKKLDDNVVYDYKYTFTYDDGAESKPDSMRISTSCENREGSLLMYRDSFGNALYPFIAESFAHSAFSREMPYNLAEASEMNVDVVIVEIVERNIENLASKAPIMPAADVSDSIGTEDIEMCENPVICEVKKNTKLQGYYMISGYYDATKIDENTRVYIGLGEKYFEACPVGTLDRYDDADSKFSIYVPIEAAAGQNLALVLNKDGKLVKTENVNVTQN